MRDLGDVRIHGLAIVFTALLLLHASPVAAQAQEDTQLWVSGEGRTDLSKRLRLSLEQELRVGADAGYDETHTDVELGYRISRHFGVAGHYRLILADGATQHRVAGDLALRYPGKGFELSYRLRLQATSRPGDDSLFPMRHRFKASVDAPARLEPFIAFELIYLLSPVAEYRETRFYLGVSWAVTKSIDLQGYYLSITETNVGQPDVLDVFGVGLSFEVGRGREQRAAAEPVD